MTWLVPRFARRSFEAANRTVRERYDVWTDEAGAQWATEKPRVGANP